MSFPGIPENPDLVRGHLPQATIDARLPTQEATFDPPTSLDELLAEGERIVRRIRPRRAALLRQPGLRLVAGVASLLTSVVLFELNAERGLSPWVWCACCVLPALFVWSFVAAAIAFVWSGAVEWALTDSASGPRNARLLVRQFEGWKLSVRPIRLASVRAVDVERNGSGGRLCVAWTHVNGHPQKLVLEGVPEVEELAQTLRASSALPQGASYRVSADG